MGRGTIQNTVSNGHGKRNPRAMASTASERSSTLPWQMSMIESSCGGVSGEVGGGVCDEVCGVVGGMLEVGTHTPEGCSLNVGLNAAACSARAACSLCSGAN